MGTAKAATIRDKQVALVTGASAGIGLALAELLAKDGDDLVLVARSGDRLRALAERLERAHGIKAHVVAADLSDPDAPAAIAREVAALGLEVDVLANNAGFGSNGAFLELDLAREAEMIQVNVAALVKLTHHFAKGMKARARGRILNVASTAGFQAGPYMATYFATKAFVVSFSEALSVELEGSGVTVTCHCPGPTATEFARAAGNEGTKLFKGGVATADEVARHAHEAMRAGEKLAIHGTFNWLRMQSLRVAPRALVHRITAGLNRPA